MSADRAGGQHAPAATCMPAGRPGKVRPDIDGNVAVDVSTARTRSASINARSSTRCRYESTTTHAPLIGPVSASSDVGTPASRNAPQVQRYDDGAEPDARSLVVARGTRVFTPSPM